MDMETSYVIVVYSNHLSFTTSAHAAISHPSTSETAETMVAMVMADTSPDVSVETRDHKDCGW